MDYSDWSNMLDRTPYNDLLRLNNSLRSSLQEIIRNQIEMEKRNNIIEKVQKGFINFLAKNNFKESDDPKTSSVNDPKINRSQILLEEQSKTTIKIQKEPAKTFNFIKNNISIKPMLSDEQNDEIPTFTDKNFECNTKIIKANTNKEEDSSLQNLQSNKILRNNTNRNNKYEINKSKSKICIQDVTLIEVKNHSSQSTPLHNENLQVESMENNQREDNKNLLLDSSNISFKNNITQISKDEIISQTESNSLNVTLNNIKPLYLENKILKSKYLEALAKVQNNNVRQFDIVYTFKKKIKRMYRIDCMTRKINVSFCHFLRENKSKYFISTEFLNIFRSKIKNISKKNLNNIKTIHPEFKIYYKDYLVSDRFRDLIKHLKSKYDHDYVKLFFRHAINYSQNYLE